MTWLRITFLSIWNRKLTTMLTIFSVGLSVALLVGVDKVSRGAKSSFEGTISQTDLIVGARSGPMQLLLYSLFHIGNPTNNLSWETYQEFKNHPAVGWTIPMSLGDSHRGYRVVATDENFYEHYKYRGGRSVELSTGDQAAAVFDVVLGAEVAAELGYSIGDHIVLAHGMHTDGIMDHDDKPFTVTGILERTATPIDRSLYITLEGMEAIHMDWQEGAPPLPGTEIPAAEVERMERENQIVIDQITAFFLRTEGQSRMAAIHLQREINNYRAEPLTAIIPGATLAELWRTLSYVENGLRLISVFVVLVGLTGMLISIYTTLNERRREMAILRALGMGPKRIIMLLVAESGILAMLGAFAGLILLYAGMFVFQGPVESWYGIHIPVQFLALRELIYVLAVIAAGFFIGLVPAFVAYRNALIDGLTPKV